MLALLAATAVWQQFARSNIILILSDDHAREAISAYGSRLIKTPAIDRLAREGIRFDRHYTTNPICAPSRATLLTGQYSHLNDLKDNGSTFDGSQQTFPKILQAAGYDTAVIGKWHLASNPTGFDHWEVLPGQGAYYNPEFLTQSGKVDEHGYVTDLITQKAVHWLDNRGSRPFFLLVGHKAPHRNWLPGPKELELFEGKTFPEPPTLRTDYSTLTTAAPTVRMRIDRDMSASDDLMVDKVPPRMDETQKAMWQRAIAPQDAAYRGQLAKSGDLLGTNYQRYLKQYLRCVAGVDRSVGEIYAYLGSKGLLKNTVVIYASDQGFFLGENGWYDKRWFYEPSAGTPLIVRPANGSKRPRAVGSLTSNLDLAPSILALAGLQIPGAMQGESLAPAIAGRASSTAEGSVYGHFYESDDGDHQAPKYVALATQRHKLIFYYELREWELFDLASDPGETKNLWSDLPSRAVRSELVRKLLEKQRQVKEEASIVALTKGAGALRRRH